MELLRTAERIQAAIGAARLVGQQEIRVALDDAEALVSFARWGPLLLWQRTLLVRLEEGASLADACRDAGVTRMTYYRYLRVSPGFRAACADVLGRLRYPRLRLRLDDSA